MFFRISIKDFRLFNLSHTFYYESAPVHRKNNKLTKYSAQTDAFSQFFLTCKSDYSFVLQTKYK